MEQVPSAVFHEFPPLPAAIDIGKLQAPVFDGSIDMEDVTQPSPARPVSFLFPAVPPEIEISEGVVELVQKKPSPDRNSVLKFFPPPVARTAVASSKLEMYTFASLLNFVLNYSFC